MEDRLCYLLQPSLESLLSEGSLPFPFRPFPYQFEGVAFLYPRHAAILADEMGLGKTMQAITTIRLLLHRGEVRNVLLVCPKPLVTNWQREFQQWAPEIPVTVIEGDQARRAWQWRLHDVPLRIANYELLCRDREIFETGTQRTYLAQSREGEAPAEPQRGRQFAVFQSARQEPRPPGIAKPYLVSRPHFDLVVLDESQRIKNRAGTTNQVVRSISRRRSWALTGTPVENSTEDLVGIFEFLAPGFISADMKPRKIGRTVSDYVLRRTKDAVLADLPPKMVHDELLDLLPEQRESYIMAEEEGVLRLSALGKSVSIQHVFELVLRLKQICNFDPATGVSAKLERLEADLEEIAASGRKAIVFSQWVQTLERLGERLNRFQPLEYHGKVPSAKRDDIVRRFREERSRHVMLMSYGAGGVGLNLQFANYVFLFDRWWNPAVEDQAINARTASASMARCTSRGSSPPIPSRSASTASCRRSANCSTRSSATPRRPASWASRTKNSSASSASNAPRCRSTWRRKCEAATIGRRFNMISPAQSIACNRAAIFRTQAGIMGERKTVNLLRKPGTTTTLPRRKPRCPMRATVAASIEPMRTKRLPASFATPTNSVSVNPGARAKPSRRCRKALRPTPR